MRNSALWFLGAVVVALLLAGVVILVGVVWLNDGLNPYRVARIRDSYRIGAPPYVQWRPDHKLILCRVRRPMGSWSGPEGDYTSGIGFYFAGLDPRTGKERPIPGLNQHFPAAYQSIGYWRLSPDCQWLLWPEYKHPHPTWFAARLDGTQIVNWPKPEGKAVGGEVPCYTWTPDSRRWVAVVQRGNSLDAAIGSLDQPGIVRTIRNVYATKAYPGYPGPALFGVTPASEAVAAIWDIGQSEAVRLFEFPINTPNPSTRSFQVSLPRGRLVRDLALSPRGDRLGWVLLSPDGRQRDELWVSRVGGTHFRRLAAVSYAPMLPMGDENHPQSLTWTPDGRNLSFIYKEGVCAVTTQ